MIIPVKQPAPAPIARPVISPGQFRFWSAVLLLLAAVMRLILLADVPPGLARDETLNADIVSFIWQGRHALFFREGYGHEPLYHYLSALFQPLLGDNLLAIRLPSVFIGLILVALCLRWARGWFGAPAGLMTGALLAVSWWPIIFSRIGLRPILLPPLLVLAVWLWPRRPGWAGLCLGLSLYTYTAARALLALPLLYGGYLLWRRWHDRRQAAPAGSAAAWTRQWRGAGIVMAVSLLVYLPLAYTLWRDPTLQERVQQLSGPLDALRQGDFGPLVRNVLATLGFFSVTGDPLWSYMLPGRPLFDWGTAIFFYLGTFVALRRSLRQSRYALLLLWFTIALAPTIVTPDAPSAIRLIGALPPIYALAAVGIAAVAGRSFAWTGWAAVSRFLFPILFVVVTALNLILTLDYGFGEWAAAPDVRQKYQSIWLDISRQWRLEPPAAPVVADAWYEPVKADSLRRDLGAALPVRWIQGGAALVLPAGGGQLYVPEFAPPDAWLLAAAGLTEPAWRSASAPSFAVYALPLAPPPGRDPLAFAPANGGGLTLLGTTWRRVDANLQLITTWRVDGPLPADLALFLHLEDESGAVVAQFDGLDAIPATLMPGDTLLQLHTLPLPAAGGNFALYLGVYRRDAGDRWLETGSGVDRYRLPDAIWEADNG